MTLGFDTAISRSRYSMGGLPMSNYSVNISASGDFAGPVFPSFFCDFQQRNALFRAFQ